MNCKKAWLTICLIILGCIIAESGGSADYEYQGTIESKRSGNIVTVLFSRLPLILKMPQEPQKNGTVEIPKNAADYIILENGKEIGSLKLISATHSSDLGAKIRVIARYALRHKKYQRLIRAGIEIVLVKKIGEPEGDYFRLLESKKITFKKEITSALSGRSMVLVPGGKFVFGSNAGSRDEYPEQVIELDDFYIDRYEVTNREYEVFIKATGKRAPLSWKGGIYGKDNADFPVLVTYYEATAFAEWEGKRLPTEEEWEKAARGAGSAVEDAVAIIYPWGNKFDPDRVNSIEFWSRKAAGTKIKDSFIIQEKGFLPVYAFEEAGASPYGVVNMSGNAKEWTSSWYLPYKGNSTINRKYGKQYKVVRGGAWYNNRFQVKSTSREPGGLPNLYKDNLAGFRLVREPSILDRE